MRHPSSPRRPIAPRLAPPHRATTPRSLARRVALVAALAGSVTVTLTPTARAQPADDRAQAGAAFKRAVAAEERGDWASALREYEAAYQLSPHPDVLFNIAAVYERTGERRAAATHYQRYLDAKPGATDRAAVEAKLASLRTHPAKLTITARPAGAAITVDGDRLGRAPRAVTVAGGSHQIVAEIDGARATRVVIVEFGEPQAIELVMVAGTGTLAVSATAPGATITVDGQPVGTTPWSGAVPAGDHLVVVAAPGFTTVERQVAVPPDGTAKVSIPMGRPIGAPEIAPPTRGGKLAMAHGGSYLGATTVFGVAVGARAASGRYDASVGIDYTGDGLSYAIKLRGNLFTGAVRPYVGGGLSYGSTGAAYLNGGISVSLGGDQPAVPEIFLESGFGVFAVNGERTFTAPIMLGVALRTARRP